MARRSPTIRLLASTSALAIVLATAPISVGIELLDTPKVYAKCCFTGETTVLMADGTAKPIAAIEIGELVMGQHGDANRVAGLYKVTLGERLLYGANGSRPFFTAEHPFLTRAGWAAVDVSAGEREAPSLSLRTLETGMQLARIDGVTHNAVSGATALANAVEIVWQPLVHLHFETRPAETPVYNLLLDGDHTYVANGFVVHNKDGDGGGGEGGDSSGSGSDGGDSGGEGGDDSGSDRDDDGGESGDNSGSGSGGGDSGGEGGGDSGSDRDDDDGESGDSGEGGESGESGESGGSGESGEGGEGGFSGSPVPAGGDLTPEDEAEWIFRGWQ